MPNIIPLNEQTEWTFSLKKTPKLWAHNLEFILAKEASWVNQMIQLLVSTIPRTIMAQMNGLSQSPSVSPSNWKNGTKCDKVYTVKMVGVVQMLIKSQNGMSAIWTLDLTQSTCNSIAMKRASIHSLFFHRFFSINSLISSFSLLKSIRY